MDNRFCLCICADPSEIAALKLRGKRQKKGQQELPTTSNQEWQDQFSKFVGNVVHHTYTHIISMSDLFLTYS